MNWLNNLKTSNKIFFLISIVSLFLIFLGITGFYFSLKANQRTSNIYNDNLQSVKLLNEVRTHTRASQADTLSIIGIKDLFKIQMLIANINRRSLEVDNDLLTFQKTYLDNFEKRNLNIIYVDIAKYRDIRNKTIQLVLTGKSQQAFNYFQNNIKPLNDLNVRLENLANYNVIQAQNAYYHNKKAFRTSIIVILSTIILSLALAIPLGIFISHLIADPLLNLSDKMKKVTEGNLNIEPVQIMSKDEMGEVTKDFNTMTRTLRSLIQRETFLRQIMTASISSLDIKNILNSIVSETGKQFKADRCFFIEYDTKAEDLTTIKDYETYISSLNTKDVSGSKFTKEELLPFYKFNIVKRQALIIDNINETEIPKVTKDILNEYNVKSVMSLPIFYRDIPIGILIIDYINEYHQFGQNEIDLASAIANQSSVLIHQAQLFNEIQESRKRESLLRTIINEVLISNSFDEAVQSIVNVVSKLFNVDRTIFRLYNPANNTFSQVIREYRKDETISSSIGEFIYPQEIDHYIATEIYDKGNILVLNNTKDPNLPDLVKQTYKNLEIKSNVAAPIIYKDLRLGVLSLANINSFKTWTNEELDLLDTVVKQISIGIYLFSLNDKLSKSLNNEKNLGNIISEARKFESHNQVIDYLLTKLIDIFNVDKSLHLHYDKTGNAFVDKEYNRDIEAKSLLNEKILDAKYGEELFSEDPTRVIIIDDISTNIRNLDLREFLKSKNIISFMIYPTITHEVNADNIQGLTIISSSSPRQWTPDEEEFYKLILDAMSIILTEIAQRQEVEETRNTFLATLTHDLRSPINAEQKALEAILSKRFGSSLENYSEFLEDIYKTNEELLRIVNNILTVYHYESGRFELKLEPNNIEDMINNSVRSMRPLAKDQNSEINVNIQENLPPVLSDKDEITRVITNLISNAIKHNRKGTAINVEATKINNEVQVSIQDNGSGIPEQEKLNIFQRYPTEKRKIGTGLGLYLSKQIINAHNGRIWFESEAGKGTTFFFTLPIA